MGYVVSASLLIVGVIHLLPAVGMLSADRLLLLYGVPLNDETLIILMRHRAVLFGLLGAFLVFAAFKESLQPLALLAGFVSLASFLLLAGTDGYTDEVRRVVVVDLVALVVLAAGAVAYWLK